MYTQCHTVEEKEKLPRREAAPSGPILVTSGVNDVGKTPSTCSLFTTTWKNNEKINFDIFFMKSTSRAVQIATPRNDRKSSLKLK